MTKTDNNPYQDALDDTDAYADSWYGEHDKAVDKALAIVADLYDNRDQLQGLVDAASSATKFQSTHIEVVSTLKEAAPLISKLMEKMK